MDKKQKAKNDAKPRRRRQNDSIADWGGIDPTLIGQVVATITGSDGAVRFGYSRDGGAYSIGIYGDGKPFTEFCPATGDVDTWLEGFILDYE